MIKLKDILKESKVSYLTEAFKSKLLRKFSMNNRGSLDRDLYSYLATQGLEASKIEDNQITKQSRLPGKGVAIAVASKKVTLYAKGNRYWESNLEIDKGTIVCVFKDGKALWYTRSWRSKDIQVKNPTAYGSEDMRTFGLNKYGWQSPNSVKKIDGIQFYKISLDEDMPYMGAKEIRKLRMDIKSGSWKWRTDNDFRSENERRYKDAITNLYDDPAKVKGVIKKTKDYANKLITGLVGGKPNAVSYAIMKGKKMDPKNESDVMRALSDITTAMVKFYEQVDYYKSDLERDKQDKERYPDNKYMGKNAAERGKRIGEMSNTITTGAFARIW
tara:strand:- start:66 stop:1055 length:990 start_codon:yes stop_codon:yes gene_type:complete